VIHNFTGMKTFVDMVEEDRPRDAVDKSKKRVMSWQIKSEDKEWLNRTAIGVMKEFANLWSTNSKLEERGFVFSSTFI
jgi:hypothetical protein